MASNVQIKFDFDNKDLELASGKVMSLTQQVRILKKELGKGAFSQAEFEIVSKKIGELEDAMVQTTARSRDLFTSLQLIPGPIGAIASQINGTIALMKTFSGFKLDDLKFQFKETIDDLKDVGSWLGKTTGITAVFEKTAGLLEGAFKKFGMSADAAAKAARGWGAALTAVGIGAAIFAIYKLIDAYNSLNAEQQLTNQLAEQSAQIAGKQISALTQLDNLLQQTTLTDRQKDEAVKTYNSTLGETLGKVENWIELEKKLIDRLPEYKDYLLKRAEAEATSMLITKAITDKIQTEMTDPASMAGFYDVWSEGGILGFFIEGKKGVGENIQKRALTSADKTIAGLQSRLMKTNEEIAKQQKALGLDKPEPKTDKPKDKTGKTPEQLAAEKLAGQKQALADQTKLEVDAEKTRESVLRPLIEKRNKLEFDEIDKAKKVADQQYKNKQLSTTEYNNLLAGFEAKKKSITDQGNQEIKNALEADKKVDEDRIKNTEDFNRRIRDIKTSAIVDDVEREKQARRDKFSDDMAELEKDKEFIKKSEEEKATIRKNYATILERDLTKIANEANDKRVEDDMTAFDRKLRILQLQGEGLINGTKEYYDNRREVLKESEDQELAQLKIDLDRKKLTQEEYQQSVTAVTKKYTRARINLGKEELRTTLQSVSTTIDAFAGLADGLAASYEEEAKTSKSAFEKRKRLQRASAVMSAASAVINIIAAAPLPGVPWVVDFALRAAEIITTGIQTKSQIDKINATKFEEGDTGGGGTTPYKVSANRASGGMVTGAGTGTSDSIPAMISNGEYVVNARATNAFLPLLTAINDSGLRPRFAGGGLVNTNNMGGFAAENISNAITTSLMDRPVKTYVVGTDMSNQQQFDRTIKSRSIM